jgi:hypothetical protein
MLTPEATGLTTTSPHAGTVPYLSYELVATEDPCVATTASDVHALACIGLEVSRNNFRGYSALTIF